MTAYASITDFKSYARITSTDTTDDGVIGDILESASKLIDTETRRTFYARVETRLQKRWESLADAMPKVKDRITG